MTPQQIRAFVAVARARSFTKAAERLGLSRALTSKHVGQLEDSLGTRLLNRTTRSVDVTPAGLAYLDRAERLLDEFDALEADMRGQGGAPHGTIRVSAPVLFGERILPAVLDDYRARYPGMRVTLSLSDRYVNLVAEGFDMGIRIGALDASSLIARRLGEMRMVCCAAPDYLAAHPAPDRPDDLADHACLLDDNLPDATLWPFEAGAVRVDGPLRADSAGMTRALAVAGHGVGLIPSFVVRGDIAAGRLVPLLEGYPLPGHAIHAIWPHARHLAPGLRAFIDRLAAYLRSPSSA